jgi:hypothetical protein
VKKIKIKDENIIRKKILEAAEKMRMALTKRIYGRRQELIAK